MLMNAGHRNCQEGASLSVIQSRARSTAVPPTLARRPCDRLCTSQERFELQHHHCLALASKSPGQHCAGSGHFRRPAHLV